MKPLRPVELTVEQRSVFNSAKVGEALVVFYLESETTRIETMSVEDAFRERAAVDGRSAVLSAEVFVRVTS